MAITEHDRHRMYQRLEEVLGPEEASTLMEHLPPVGWADVATKRDLDQLRIEMSHMAEILRGEIAGAANMLRAEFRRDQLNLALAMFAANAAIAGVLFGALKLT